MSSFSRWATECSSNAKNRSSRPPAALFLPDQAKKKSKRGKVLGVGNGKLDKEGKRIPLAVKSGDRVLFSGYSGEEIEVNGKEVLLIREDDILAVIHD